MREHHHMHPHPHRLVLAATLLALGTAACGSTSTVTSVRTAVATQAAASSATSAQSASASGTATSPITSSSTSAASTASGPPCTAGLLSLASEGTNGAAGTIVAYFSLRNISTRPCHTSGYPGVLFLTRAGVPLPTKAIRTTHDRLGHTPLTEIVLAPGALASLRIVASLIGSGAGCPTAYGLQVIAPDDTATMRTTIPNGLFECTTVTVSPLAAGSGIPAGT